jgi:glycosyltransferase involved in cell wall biosynthesis
MAEHINSPILYLLIKPSESPVCLQALKDVKYIGCSTQEDWEHVKKFNVEHKSFKVTHGISLNDCLGVSGRFKEKYGIQKDKRMFLSCGGYWPNKRMIELADAFRKANLSNAILVTTGYDNRHNIMPHASENVIPLMVEDPKDVKDAIADADCYVMNSDTEGFGLVLIESMLNKTNWMARNIAAAKMLSEFGTTYNTEEELVELFKTFKPKDTQLGYEHIMNNFLIRNTIDDIENILTLNTI